MSICRVISCAVGGGHLLWPGCSLGKTLLAFVLLHFVLQGQTCLLLSLDFLLLHFHPLWWKGHLFFFFLVLVLGLVGLHRTFQLQLLQHHWSGHRLGLLWCWKVCLGNKPRLFHRFWDCSMFRAHILISLFPWWIVPFIVMHCLCPLLTLFGWSLSRLLGQEVLL